MPVVKSRPTSPGTRFRIKVKHEGLHKGKPARPLIQKKTKRGGRNNEGRITIRHRGGEHKRHYRRIDFHRDKINVPGRVARLEYDPNRSAHIALVVYKDGEKRYIIAPNGLVVGAEIISSNDAPIKPGNTLELGNVPLGTVLHCVELKPKKGAQLARSAGTSVQLVAREGNYVTIRLRSGEMRKVLAECKATIGVVSNSEHNLRSLGKAGKKRHLGIRPTVRGVAMNPIDHPHGGGEGKTSGGRHPVSPTGRPTKGYKTRRNKRTTNMIVRSRRSKKKG